MRLRYQPPMTTCGATPWITGPARRISHTTPLSLRPCTPLSGLPPGAAAESTGWAEPARETWLGAEAPGCTDEGQPHSR